MGNIIVGALIFGAAAFIVRGRIKNKKKGTGAACHGDCGSCNGYCRQSGENKKEKQEREAG